MIRRPPRSTLSSSSAASDVYKRQVQSPRTATSALAATDNNIVPVASSLRPESPPPVVGPRRSITFTKAASELSVHSSSPNEGELVGGCLLYTSPSPRDS
eukprot:TRINITY_DN62025_c0_g1_i1.p1 TRINITY_DN62025_c0_g1~~TRINITY_DN62025_c0_g1_i1.p1  ORF type:complete len:100 (-),score=19.82 TRINITY_DN62025_c0_g1_i1:167-466(-)